MYCEMCGARIDDDSVFCENCGARVEDPQSENPQPADDLEELMNMDRGAGYSEAAEKTMIFRKPHNEPESREDEDRDEAALQEREELSAEPNQESEESFAPEDAQEDLPEQTDESSDGKAGQTEVDEWQDEPPAQEADLQEFEVWEELQRDEDERQETETWKREEPAQEVDCREASEEESWAAKWGDGPQGSSSWDRGMTNTDEWLQEEIEKTMRSLQQSSDHFVYEDRSGTILQGDPELFDEEYEMPDRAGNAAGAESGPEPDCLTAESLAGEPQKGADETQNPGSDLPESGPEEQKQQRSAQGEWKQQADPSGSDVEATSFPPKDLEKTNKKLKFCMTCGRVLPPDAAFCQDCGTPVGAIDPGAVSGREGTGMGISLLKNFFKKPAETIERAAVDGGFLSGIGFLLIKDALIAVLAALFAGKVSVLAGAVSGWLLSSDPFGFGAKIFLCGIVLDALWIAVVWGAGRLFHGLCSVKALTGACGTAGLFTTVLFLITILLSAFAPAAAGCGLAVTGAVTLIAMVKAASAALCLSEDQLMFHMAVAAACYSIILFALLKLCQ